MLPLPGQSQLNQEAEAKWGAGVFGAVGCPGDMYQTSVWLTGIWLIPGLEIYKLRDLLACQSLIPWESSSVFLGGVEGLWRNFLYQLFA